MSSLVRSITTSVAAFADTIVVAGNTISATLHLAQSEVEHASKKREISRELAYETHKQDAETNFMQSHIDNQAARIIIAQQYEEIKSKQTNEVMETLSQLEILCKLPRNK